MGRMELEMQRLWSLQRRCGGAVSQWTVVVLLSSLQLGLTNSEQFTIDLTSTTNVELDVNLGDTVTVFCPSDRYDNILYLRTVQQLRDCNASAVPPDFPSNLPSYLSVGSCAGSTVASFNIDIRRTSGFLASSVPFQNGGTYHFTSFTDGTAISAAMKPTSGGDCTRGLALILNIIDPNIVEAPSISTELVKPTSSPTARPTTESGNTEPSVLGIMNSGSRVLMSLSLTTLLFLLSLFVLL